MTELPALHFTLIPRHHDDGSSEQIKLKQSQCQLGKICPNFSAELRNWAEFAQENILAAHPTYPNPTHRQM